MKVFFIALFILSQTLMVKAQDASLESTVNTLNDYYNSQPREKLYLHLDKSYYRPGERIWFKAYLTAGNFNYLSPISKILYVELINTNAEIEYSIRLPVSHGISFGDILIPEQLRSGKYRIRAYSNWMRNFNAGYFYNREIQIGLPADTPEKVDNGRPSIQFFTENGKNLIAGLENKLVFKIDDPDSGIAPTIVDNLGKSLDLIKAEYGGIGSFSFVPEMNTPYKALVSRPNGAVKEIPLPEVVSEGLLINTNTWNAEQVFVRLSASPSFMDNQPINIIFQKEGEVFYAAKHTLDKAQITFGVSKANFPTGVVSIGIFSSDMRLLAQKNIFIQHDQSLMPIVADAAKKRYGSRELVQVKLSTGTESDSVRVSTLSVAVTHDQKVPSDPLTEPTINSFIHLRAESAGEILAPAYYLQADSLSIRNQLDNLVMTFERDEMWDNQKSLNPSAIAFPPEKDLTISGTVTRKNGDPIPFAKVLVLASELGSVMDTVADENGRFIFDRLLFYEDTKFVVQARDEKGRKQVDILLDETGNHEVSANEISGNAPFSGVRLQPDTSYYSSEELSQANSTDRSILLENVKIDVKKKNPAQHSSNLNGPGNADQVIDAEDLSTCSDLRMCLQGRLMGVIFVNGVPYSTRSPNIPMQVIVDGAYLDGEALSMIPVFDVAAIEVLRRPGSLGIYGSMGAGGVIIVTTKRGGGDFSADLYSPGIVTFSPQGLYEISTFYSPDYSKADSSSNEADRRSTIYWNPNIVTDENGNAAFDFYTADESGTYRIVVEGIDINGRIGRKEFFIDVTR